MGILEVTSSLAKNGGNQGGNNFSISYLILKRLNDNLEKFLKT